MKTNMYVFPCIDGQTVNQRATMTIRILKVNESLNQLIKGASSNRHVKKFSIWGKGTQKTMILKYFYITND